MTVGRVLRVLLAIGVAAGGLAVVSPAAVADDAGPVLHDGFGLHVIARQRVDDRLLKLTVRTAALPGPAHVDVLLPTGYDPETRYPVLYLLHGTEGGADDWIDLGDAERATAGLPLIVVLPDIALDGAGGGWCTNWVNGGRFGVPEWETFHIDELIPWVDANLPTRADRGGRAIAGVSQGGFCSMSYAARHPDLFGTAVSYSGAPDIAWDAQAQAMAWPVISTTEVAMDQVPVGSMFGSPLTNQLNWAAHDPATLAENLSATNLLLYNGNGAPGPLDDAPLSSGTPVEVIIGVDNQLFQKRLAALGITSYWDDYGPGTHSWPYWARDLTQSLPRIMADFADPSPAPAAVTYTSAEDSYHVYGWRVRMDRPAREFSTLADASAHGFRLTGSGAADVITPADYVPGRRYRVVQRPESGPRSVSAVRADASGRLSVSVRLGPPNRYQQDTLAATLAGTEEHTTAVTIRPAGGAGR